MLAGLLLQKDRAFHIHVCSQLKICTLGLPDGY